MSLSYLYLYWSSIIAEVSVKCSLIILSTFLISSIKSKSLLCVIHHESKHVILNGMLLFYESVENKGNF